CTLSLASITAMQRRRTEKWPLVARSRSMRKGEIFPLIEVEQKLPRATCSVQRATPQRISRNAARSTVSNGVHGWRAQNGSANYDTLLHSPHGSRFALLGKSYAVSR